MGAAGPVDGEFATVDCRYLIVIPIPCYVDGEGAVWLERLWHHDLVQHLRYLRDLVLCAPRLPWAAGLDLVRVEPPASGRLAYAFLPPQTSYLGALLRLPRTAVTLWRAIRRADIVHSGVIGWPYPLGWLANPMTLLQGKRLVVVVESSWRIGGAHRTGWKHRLADLDPLREALARWSCNHADLALFTHAGYLEDLCTRERAHAVVVPAVWVREADLLTEGAAADSWEEKAGPRVRMLLAGRLVAEKGLDVLLESLRLLEARGVVASIDVVGLGDRREACLDAAAGFRTVRLSVLDPVPYGAPFFDLVRRYHVVVVPSLGDEQPRIVFDANAQAVPVIASDTDGLRPHVQHGRTGWLVRRGDAEALAEALARASGDGSGLRAMGMAALGASQAATHESMHRRRSRLVGALCRGRGTPS